MHGIPLDTELEELKSEILRMGELIENSVYRAVKSLFCDQPEAASEVVASDDQVDRYYKKVQDKGLRLLALHQPLAVDLRTVQAGLQIATDLERMGDYAEKIAKITLRLHNKRSMTHPLCLETLSSAVLNVVSDALNSYAQNDTEKAVVIIAEEDCVDGLYRRCFEQLVDIIKEDPNKAEMAVQLLFASYSLERIADHATNIGEAVVYMVTGKREDFNE